MAAEEPDQRDEDEPGETGDLVERASLKRKDKGMDFILANDPTAAGSGFGTGNHQVTLIGRIRGGVP